eukprot:gene9674-11368_t
MIEVIRSSKLGLKSLACSRAMSKIVADITGNPYKLTSDKAAWNMDESIIDMLSSNNDARPKLREILQDDTGSSFSKILILFENLRYGMDYRIPEIAQSLVEIEGMLVEGKLTRREGYYAAAALAWYEGNYLKCGALLETSLVNSRGDLLAVRLAQNAYLAAGSSKNVLNCVIRQPSTQDSPKHLEGYLLGMFATGYVETGSLLRAEEEGLRAVVATKGQNSWALHALLNSLQLQGRSSEMNAHLDMYGSKHTGAGRANLFFNRGSAHILRGNYTGAYKAVEELVETLETQYKLGDNSHDVNLWSNAVLLLWNLCINISDLNDVAFNPMWKILSKYESHGHPMHDLCTSMALASASAITPATPRPTPVAAAPEVIPTPSKESSPSIAQSTPSAAAEAATGGLQSFWQTITGSARHKAKQSYTPGADSSKDENFKYITSHIRGRFKSSDYKELMQTNHEVLFQAHTTRLMSPRAHEQPVACPKLRSIQPDSNLVKSARLSVVRTEAPALPAVSLADLSDADFSRREFVAPYSAAMKQFTEKRFAESNDLFMQFAPVLNLLGGTATQRELINHMCIESAYRANNTELAFYMLRERSFQVPNDAQCWRRLAGVYGHNGQEELATRAHYTAWTLGIEQGGFGGAR